ncbi:MAG TPA: WYL domain-containing protein [Acidimicrobiia bacterium]|nr:WYL domain-containing protein [Acidimicrobiia bacterium]
MKNVLERLLNLLAFLLTVGRSVSADEVRQTVAGYDPEADEAFRRMFERDKDLLRKMGIPLETIPASGSRTEVTYAIDPDKYGVPDPNLTEEERAALWLASQVVRIGGRTTGLGSFLKLGGAISSEVLEPLSADLGEEADVLADIYEAVARRRMISLGYSGRERRLAPYGLGHRRGHWYLVGIEGGETKVFRVDRMRDVKVAEDTFDRDPSIRVADELEAHPWEAGTEPTIRTSVRIDPSLAWWAERRLGRSRPTIEHQEDGGVLITLDVSNPDAFVGWVLGFGAAAEVVSPPEMRERMVDRIRGDG